MPRVEQEFAFPSAPWMPVEDGVAGTWYRLLSRDEGTGDYTRLLRFDPEVNTSPIGVRTHDYWEEVYILEGDLTDLGLGKTFTAGMYACRPPGMRHGPWSSTDGCLTFEVRYAPPAEGHGRPG